MIDLFIPKLANMKNLRKQYLVRMWSNGNTTALGLGIKIGTTTLGNGLSLHSRYGGNMPGDLMIPLFQKWVLMGTRRCSEEYL